MNVQYQMRFYEKKKKKKEKEKKRRNNVDLMETKKCYWRLAECALQVACAFVIFL